MKLKSLVNIIFAFIIFSCVSTMETPVNEELQTEIPQEIPQETQEVEPANLFTPIQLEYVIYHDTRMNDAYLSIAYLDEDTYLISRKELETGKIVSLTMTVINENGGLGPENIRMIQGELADAFAANMIPDILNMITQRHRTAVDDITEKVGITDEWTDYSLIHSYNKWIPLFNLYSTRIESETENKIQLIKIGALKNSNDNDFYNFELPSEINKTPEYIINYNTDIISNVNNLVSIRLDENWQLNENNMHVLSNETVMDAVIFAEVLDLNSLYIETIDDFVKMILCYQDGYINTESISVDIFNSYLTLSFNIYDIRTKSYSKAFNVFVPTENERVFIVITLNTFLTLYNSNKNYFDKILF